MSYNFELAMSATLSVKVVEEMIRKVVEEQTGKKITTVNFDITEEYNARNYRVVAFTGCTVKFESSKAPSSKAPSASLGPH